MRSILAWILCLKGHLLVIVSVCEDCEWMDRASFAHSLIISNSVIIMANRYWCSDGIVKTRFSASSPCLWNWTPLSITKPSGLIRKPIQASVWALKQNVSEILQSDKQIQFLSLSLSLSRSFYLLHYGCHPELVTDQIAPTKNPLRTTEASASVSFVLALISSN